VCAFADRLRCHRFHVLATGGNQGAAFRFPVGGRWKAPDLVAERNGYVLVAEGKIRARELFKSTNRGFSDFTSMNVLAQTPELQALICAEVADRMDTYGEKRDASKLVVSTGLFAADDLFPWRDILSASPVLSFVVDVTKQEVRRCVPNTASWTQYESLGF
jgi:hypothetical protein